MESIIQTDRLDRSVDHTIDHVLGPTDAPIRLVEYGSYACPHCRAANERIAQARDLFLIPLHATLNQRAFKTPVSAVKIKVASNAPHIGVIGASLL